MPHDVKKQLETALSRIPKLAWFGEDWKLRITEPDDGGTAWCGIQLYKGHWFNDEGLGIHIDEVLREVLGDG